MEKIKLSLSEYRDKMHGCWLGKNIGGTLGGPFEAKKYTHCLTYFDWDACKKDMKEKKERWEKFFKVKLSIDPDKWSPGEPLPNDDLDFQLVWLKMLEDRGVKPTFKDFTDYWLKYLSKHWYAEYSWCTYNLLRGLKPPISGAFQNYFVDEMGSPIRSEIWACVAPGDPQLAASLAWMDSSMDHTGGEGRWGEMFWAAVESAAFVISDPMTLIKIGLSMIPISSNIARVIKEAVRCYKERYTWGDARERIVTLFGHYRPCNAIPNHGFTIIGWLYGKDFGDKLCKAVNCGYDTDCTAATLGALLGIINGASGIPEEWKKPVGNKITPVPMTVIDGLPLDINELVDRTQKVAEKMVSERSDSVEFGNRVFLPEKYLSLLFKNEKIEDLLTFDNHSSVENINGYEIIFHYGGEPVLYPKIEKDLKITIKKDEKEIKVEGIEIKGIKNWIITQPIFKNGKYKFTIYAEKVNSSNKVEIYIKHQGERFKSEFILLSPDSIKEVKPDMRAPIENF